MNQVTADVSTYSAYALAGQVEVRSTSRSTSQLPRLARAQVRDLYWTFRNFRARVADFLRYRRVTANMDERFPDATPDDLARADGLCIICREDLGGPGGRAKRLPCNHVFHLHCLRCVPALSSICLPKHAVLQTRGRAVEC